MDYTQMTAPCGMDCFNCPVYLANENDAIREYLAKTWGIPPEEAACNGCRTDGDRIALLTNGGQPCSVLKCIAEKDIDFCCDCDDFPCDHLHPYADRASEFYHNSKVFNLCLIKKMGLENWAQSKAKSVKDTYMKGKFKM